jgi:chorismate-pyruvate lyase
MTVMGNKNKKELLGEGEQNRCGIVWYRVVLHANGVWWIACRSMALMLKQTSVGAP